MKARELMELLQKAHPDSDVIFTMSEGCCGDYRFLESAEAELCEPTAYSKKVDPDAMAWVTVSFAAVPGYRSCIQTGQTLKDDREYWAKFGQKHEDNP